jgi:NADPH-dependent glutamate synthase beta subunit-like oxidoreductase/NAD(P)H-flavin reductase
LSDSSQYDFDLGIPGFRYSDLHRVDRLKDLAAAFDLHLQEADRGLFARFDTWRRGSIVLKAPEASSLLIAVARHLSAFLITLFRVDQEANLLRKRCADETVVFEFKREFVVRRVYKKGAPNRPAAADFPDLENRIRRIAARAFPGLFNPDDPEKQLAECVVSLMRVEKRLSEATGSAKKAFPEQDAAEWKRIIEALGDEVGALIPSGPRATGTATEADLALVRALLDVFDRWCFARALDAEGRRAIADWSSYRLPKPVDFMNLVELERPDPKLPEMAVGPEKHLRRRVGFQLTDRRFSSREVHSELDYCVLCHEREKDSCSRGFAAKDGQGFTKNPLGIPLAGCPLDERIGEMHALAAEGDPIAALSMIAIDNPMAPGTGHRICNDCMKGCIFQKQDPVNIPQAETGVLTDVLNLPFGFEIYSLLTRWNPLNPKRPYALPYNGKNILVVGLGPAGYTLAHFLLNEGFGVVGIDGLKIEPLPESLVGRPGVPPRPVKHLSEIDVPLDKRILAGFGGVSEYGITVRWDKTFLTVIYLSLARRERLRIYGGVRFGGTITLEDAWRLGIDHVAIATGAGKPTIAGMKNDLIRGVRQASDFLMALQLTGAFKAASLANLQVQLPAVVIGGGLTAIDTATELAAYYPIQAEKALQHFETLARDNDEASLWARFDAEESRILQRLLDHGRAVREERNRAEAAREPPDFQKLVRSWGGVTIVYRKSLTDSPAYRLNHEEVIKCLEEGIHFLERMSPLEALKDEFGALAGVRFERQVNQDGKWRGSGETIDLPAKACCVAAGTSPNITYEREHPGTFDLDDAHKFFRVFSARSDGPSPALERATVHQDTKSRTGFFTSHVRDGHLVSYYGDNHPQYAGSVVKAMASAKQGYPQIVRLFEKEIASLDPSGQAERDHRWHGLIERLDAGLRPTVLRVDRLTPTIVEVIVRAPFQAERFHPGQFYRLQNYEVLSPEVDGTRMTMEGIALTGAWVDREKGLLSLIVLEMGGSSRLCSTLVPGQPVVVMGPTGTPTEIPSGENVLLAGGGLGNAVLFSIAKALRLGGNRVVYFAGYKRREDFYKRDEIESASDQVVYSVDAGELIDAHRPQDRSFRGNIVQAMVAYAEGKFGNVSVPMKEVNRIIAIGSDRMMAAVKEARKTVLAPHLRPEHIGIASINSPMQCMMKEICAQCLQRHVDPSTGKETFVFSCFNQDQPMDRVDFHNLADRLRANSVLEKLTNGWIDHLFQKAPQLKRV